MIEKKIEYLDITNYKVMEYSKIFLSISDFVKIENKYATKQMTMKKKLKNKNYQTNQTSFYFDDYLETNKKNISLKKIIFFKIEFIFIFFIFFFNLHFRN